MKSKLFKKHKKRVEKVREFTGKNAIFVIMAIVALVFLFSNILSKSDTPPKENQAVITEEIESENPVTDSKIEPFRFYFIDLIILVGGGGVCVVMILRERRKTKEELK